MSGAKDTSYLARELFVEINSSPIPGARILSRMLMQDIGGIFSMDKEEIQSMMILMLTWCCKCNCAHCGGFEKMKTIHKWEGQLKALGYL
jgi:hypothetical protein